MSDLHGGLTGAGSGTAVALLPSASLIIEPNRPAGLVSVSRVQLIDSSELNLNLASDCLCSTARAVKVFLMHPLLNASDEPLVWSFFHEKMMVRGDDGAESDPQKRGPRSLSCDVASFNSRG